MSGTVEENTRWIGVWIINDPLHFDAAQRAAEFARDLEDYGYLRSYVADLFRRSFQAGDEESAVAYAAREMSEADMDLVDWEEVASDLID